MESIATAIRNKLEKVGAALEEKYPGVTEELIAKFFEGVEVPVKKAKKAQADKAVKQDAIPAKQDTLEAVEEEQAKVEVPVIEDDKSEKTEGTKAGRSRTVSKKMKEVFIKLAGSEEKLEACTKAYKVASDEKLQACGGDFEGFARDFLEMPLVAKPAKKEKAKKEVKPTRIPRWTPTLTRDLIKVVEESGGKMEDSIKKAFHEWIDAMTEDEFAMSALAGHMRRFVLSKVAPQPEGSGAAAGAGPAASPALVEEEADEEDMDEIEVEGEKLFVGVKTGKMYRPTPTGDIWVGNAGIGKYANVKKPE